MPGVRYQRVVWHHDDENEPAVLWSEIDERGWESRKVDKYRDGRLDYADKSHSIGTTQLSDQAMPTLAEINARDGFDAAPTSPDDFENVWRLATAR
jgi:hypothetical protein